MSITMANLTSSATTGNGTSITTAVTASVTPTSNRPVFVSVYNTRNGTTPVDSVNTILGLGITNWSQIQTAIRSGSAFARTSAWYGFNASPSASVVTVGFASAQSAILVLVDEAAGANVSGTVVQSSNSSTGNITAGSPVTLGLAAFGNVANATYGVYGVASGPPTNVYTADTLFLSLVSTSALTSGKYFGQLWSMWTNVNESVVSAKYGGTDRHMVIGMELKATLSTARPAAYYQQYVQEHLIA